MIKSNIHLGQAFSILLGLVISLSLISKANSAPHLTLDLTSGNVLSHQNAFDPWHPASLTKLMTAYVAFKAIKTGKLSADHPVVISKNARRQPPSKMGYRTGTRLTMEDALKLLVIKSANDVATAIAESISGTSQDFAARMNQEAKALGMNGSRFINPHGLHDKRQVTTARDMGILVAALHNQFPNYRSYFSTPSVLAPSRTKNGKLIKRIYYSYNLLLERYRGADGFKTGFVCASGYNFIGAASRSGRRIAAVIFGRDSQTSRAVDAAKFITAGFEQPVHAGTPLLQFRPAGPVPSGPRNMRSILCTNEARAARYEPGAGQAVIKSPWLQSRKVSLSPLSVELLPRATTALAGSRIPLPSFRPKAREITTTTKPDPIAGLIKSGPVGIPIPKFRPRISDG